MGVQWLYGGKRMTPAQPTHRSLITATLTGAAIPVISGVLLLIYQEFSSAIVFSVLRLEKSETSLILYRIGYIGQLAVPGVNVLLTTVIAFSLFRRYGSAFRRAPILMGATSALSMLILGITFSLSFNPAEIPSGLWNCTALFLTIGGCFIGGNAGLRINTQRNQLSELAGLRSQTGSLEAVLSSLGEALRDVPVDYICLVGVSDIVDWQKTDDDANSENIRRHCIALVDGADTKEVREEDVHGTGSEESKVALDGLGFKSIAIVPAVDRVVDDARALIFLSKKRRVLGRRSWLLPFISSQALLCLENVGLIREVKNASVLDERQRVAKEFHDTVAQNLMGIILNLEAVRGNNLDEAARNHVNVALDTARKALNETRSIIWALKPTILDENPLPTALSRTLEEWSRTNHIAVRFDVKGTPHRLPTDVEIALFRIQQEACSNISKHAHASTAEATLIYERDSVSLCVRDSGCGFEPEIVDGTGFGLTTMRRRVFDIGGSFTLRTPVGGGAEVFVRIPFRHKSYPEVRNE